MIIFYFFLKVIFNYHQNMLHKLLPVRFAYNKLSDVQRFNCRMSDRVLVFNDGKKNGIYTFVEGENIGCQELYIIDIIRTSDDISKKSCVSVLEGDYKKVEFVIRQRTDGTYKIGLSKYK